MVALCAVIYLLTSVQSLNFLSPTRGSSLAHLLWLVSPEVAPGLGMGDVYRGLTFSFVHSSVDHIFFNALMLWIFGAAIEARYGSAAMAAMIVATSFGSAIAISWLSPMSVTVGASGVIYGLMAIACGMVARNKWKLRPIMVLIAINLGFSVISPGVSLSGHLGGLCAGAIIAVVIAAVETGMGARVQPVARQVAAGGKPFFGPSVLGGQFRMDGAQFGAGVVSARRGKQTAVRAVVTVALYLVAAAQIAFYALVVL